MSQKPVLAYWDIRGLAQPIRYLLVYAGQEFEDKYYKCGPGPEYNKDCWFNDKFTLGLDFPNLPYFIDGDVRLTQSGAILRYLANKHGLQGKTVTEINRQELAYEEAVDVRRQISGISYNKDYESLKPGFVKFATEKAKELDKFLGDNPWFAGSNLTFVDFVLYEILVIINRIDPAVLSGCNSLQQFIGRFEELPALKQYIQSDGFRSLPLNNKMAAFGNQ